MMASFYRAPFWPFSGSGNFKVELIGQAHGFFRARLGSFGFAKVDQSYFDQNADIPMDVSKVPMNEDR